MMPAYHFAKCFSCGYTTGLIHAGYGWLAAWREIERHCKTVHDLPPGMVRVEQILDRVRSLPCSISIV